MPKPVADDHKTKAGGCRPPTPDESKHVTPLPQHVIDDLKARHKAQLANPLPKGTWLAMFNAAFEDESQAGTGMCVACAITVAVKMAGLLQGIRIPKPSSPFGYFTSSGDATFTKGSSISWSTQNRAIGPGCCNDSVYPIVQVLTAFNAWPGHVFTAAELPQPPAYADALTRKILQWHAVPKDTATIQALIAAGHPIAFGLGNHARCIIDMDADGYVLYCKDSEAANLDQGYGRGVVGVTMTTLIASGYDLVTVMLIDPGKVDTVVATPPPPPPLTGNAMLRDQAIAGWTALDPANFTQQQKDQLVSYAQQLTPTVVVVNTPPPPPSGAVFMPPAVQLVDGAGYTWTRGAFVSDRYGYQLLCNGRGLKTTLNNALVGGKFRCNDAGTWYEFSGNPYAPVWTQTTAP